MSRQDVSDELLTLLGAGHETTASTLGWAFERLRRHPDVLAELVKENDEGGSEFRQATILELQRNRTVIDFAGRHVAAPHFDLGDWRIPHGYTVWSPSPTCTPIRTFFPNPERFDPYAVRRQQAARRRGCRSAVEPAAASALRSPTSRWMSCYERSCGTSSLRPTTPRKRRSTSAASPYTPKDGGRIVAAPPRVATASSRPSTVPARASAASSPAAGSGRCTRSGSARDSPGARARLPRSRSPASPR